MPLRRKRWRQIRRLKDVLSFSKPKGSGLTISKGCYLSVLAARAQMPRLLDAINPKGENGAVAGFGVPLAKDAKKEDLNDPMKRGVYALSSPDRKTVLKMMVMPKEEAGFDPAAFARTEAALSWESELRLRVESTWMLMQLTFESYDPEAYPALDFFLSIARRLAALSDGVVADPVSQVYRLPEQVFSARPDGVPIAATDHVQAKTRVHEGALHAYTLGLTKFDHPEVELYGLSGKSEDGAKRFLTALAQSVLLGSRLEPGASVGVKGSQLKVAAGGLDRGMWEGVPCLELIPEPQGTTDVAVAAWVASVDR